MRGRDYIAWVFLAFVLQRALLFDRQAPCDFACAGPRMPLDKSNWRLVLVGPRNHQPLSLP